MAVAVPGGEGTKKVVHEKAQLTVWLCPYLSQVRRKRTVRRTRGSDGDALVILCRPDDYEGMVRIYLALKAWVRRRGLTVA